MKTLITFISGVCLVSLAQADVLSTRTLVHTGEVTRVTSDGVTIKIAMGEVTVPTSEITGIDVPKPAGLAAAATAVRAKNYPDAIKLLKPLVDNLAGLPMDWMQDAVLLLGDAYAGVPDAINARKVYDQFKQLYKDSPKATLVDGKYARILVEQKQYAQAIPLLKKFLDPLLQKQSITDTEEQATAEALLLLGDCQRNTGELYPALDSYLTITTLFDVDPFITVPARQRAAEIFEQQKRWPRARQTYQDLIDHGPPPAVADDARKKLAALNAAHPE